MKPLEKLHNGEIKYLIQSGGLDKMAATKTRQKRLINYTTKLLYLLLILAVGGIFKEHTNQ
jgi:hypothetical protein